MTVAPSIRLVAYADRPGNFVFVAVPDERGRYIRTDRSVVLVPCPMCRAIKGEPCKSGVAGYGGTTHAVRRAAAKSLNINGRQDDAIDPPALPQQILGSITLIEPRAI